MVNFRDLVKLKYSLIDTALDRGNKDLVFIKKEVLRLIKENEDLTKENKDLREEIDGLERGET